MSKITLSDKAEVVSKDVMSNGFMRIKAKFARTGVQNYYAKELGLTDRPATQVVKLYRPPEEVFKQSSMDSFASKPVTDDHPSVMVTADNARQFSIGWAGDTITQDGKFLAGFVTLSDSEAIAKFKAGKNQLSNGYDMSLDMTAGVSPEGEAYDGVQRDIDGNHIALVDAGRCGTECRVGDHMITDCGCDQCKAGGPKLGDEDVVEKVLRTIAVDGITIETTDQGAQVIEKLQKQLIDAQAAVNAAEAKAAATDITHAAAIATKDGEIAGLKSKVPTAEALDALVTTRTKLVADCLKVLGKDYDPKGKSEEDLRRAVVAKRLGDAAIVDKSAEYISACFDAVMATADSTKDVKPAADPVRDALLKTKTDDQALTAEQARAAWIKAQDTAWQGTAKQ